MFFELPRDLVNLRFAKGRIAFPLVAPCLVVHCPIALSTDCFSGSFPLLVDHTKSAFVFGLFSIGRYIERVDRIAFLRLFEAHHIAASEQFQNRVAAVLKPSPPLPSVRSGGNVWRISAKI